MPMLVTDPGRADNPIIYVNQAFTQLTGYAREEILGTNCRFLQGPGTNLDDVAKVRKAIEDRQSIEIDLLNYRKNGTSFWNRLLVSPVFDAAGQLTHFFASQFDVSPERNRLAELAFEHGELEAEIAKRMQDIAMTEARLRFVLGAAGMGTWTGVEANNKGGPAPLFPVIHHPRHHSCQHTSSSCRLCLERKPRLSLPAPTLRCR
jgi:PAS domain S-box-containing protein